MMKFSDKKINSKAADDIVRQLLSDIGPGPWTVSDIQRMVDAGCAAAIKALHNFDTVLNEAVADFPDEPEQDLVQVIMLAMIVRTTQQGLDVVMVESLFKALGVQPPRA